MKKNLSGMFSKMGLLVLAVVPALGCGVEPLDAESEAKQAAMQDVGVTESAITYGGHDYLFVTTPKTWVSFICERDAVPTTNRGSFSYSASNTASATANTSNHSIHLHAGQVFTAATCGVPGSSGSGNTCLRLNNPFGQEIAHNDDAGAPCGVLSNLSIVVPVTGTYTLRAGCFNSGSCGGTVAFNC